MTIEERLDALEAQNAKLENQLERLKAAREIENLMCRGQYYHTACENQLAMEQFALKQPDVCACLSAGVFRGPEGIDRFFNKFFPHMEGDMMKGLRNVHAVTTGVIEVAEDCKTARAMWLSPGHETMKFPGADKFEGVWSWCYYAVDFIREDGEWKLWHFCTYPSIRSAYDKCWTEQLQHRIDMDRFPEECRPDAPWPRCEATFWDPEKLPTLDPVPPEPYATWSEVEQIALKNTDDRVN